MEKFIDSKLFTLDELFRNFELQECQEMLWFFLREAMTGDTITDSEPDERAQLWHFYECLLALIQTNYAVFEKKRKARIKALS